MVARQLRVGDDFFLWSTTDFSARDNVIIFWSAIGRVVYGIDAVRLRVFRGERAEQRDAELSCRDVFAASPHAIHGIGPALIPQASEAHLGFWKA